MIGAYAFFIVGILFVLFFVLFYKSKGCDYVLLGSDSIIVMGDVKMHTGKLLSEKELDALGMPVYFDNQIVKQGENNG